MQASRCDHAAAAPELADRLAPVRAELDALGDDLAADLASSSPEVERLIDHVGQYRGKQLRPALVYLWAKATGGVCDAHHVVARVVELIHLATLVHDDVLDGADIRRRVPTVNAMCGNEVPVLLGDYIYARAFWMSVSLDDLTCSRLLADVTRVMCQGEITQILHRFDFGWTEDRYRQVIRDKTASLYSAACRLGVHYAGRGAGGADNGASEALLAAAGRYGEELGIAFQIVDDCLDLDGDEGVVGKSLGTDVVRGKLTLPLLYLMRDPAAERRLRELLRPDHGASVDGAAGNAGGLLTRLHREFDLSGAITAALDEARGRVDAALAALAALPAGPEREALAGVAEYVVQRRR